MYVKSDFSFSSQKYTVLTFVAKTVHFNFPYNVLAFFHDKRLPGLTQERLAEEVGLSNNYISMIERGDRTATLDTLVEIAKRLGVSIDYLLSDSIPIDTNTSFRLWQQLMANRTEDEQKLVVDMIKLLFSHLDS